MTRYIFSLRTSPVLESLQVPTSWHFMYSLAHDMLSFTWNRQLFAVTSVWQKSSEPWHYVLCVSSHFKLKSMGFESVNGSHMHRDNNFHYHLQDLLLVKENKWSRLKVVKYLLLNIHIGTYTVQYQSEKWERNVVIS